MLADFKVKFSLIGDSGVGKSSLLFQLTENSFLISQEVTIGVEYGAKVFRVKYKDKVHPIKVQVWDTAGQEAFRSIVSSYYRDVAALLVVFDVCKMRSFKNLDYWISEARKINTHAVITVIGNKIDETYPDKRQVSRKEAEEYAKKHDYLYFETSAKTSKNVHDAFKKTVERCMVTPNIEFKRTRYNNVIYDEPVTQEKDTGGRVLGQLRESCTGCCNLV